MVRVQVSAVSMLQVPLEAIVIALHARLTETGNRKQERAVRSNINT
jgi:hypothetical protein